MPPTANSFAVRACYTTRRMARQKLGQHFLSDAGWREKIARAIGVSRHSIGGAKPARQDCVWIEIGAGHGEMTRHLLETGADVIAIEFDPPLVQRLNDLAAEFRNLTVVAGDVLQADIAALAARRRVRVYGNLPYYITSPILHHLFQFADLLDEIHIVIQLEVAFRLVARPGNRDYGYLSVLTQYFSRPNLAMKIPPGAFRPPPEVASALVLLRLPGEQAKLALPNESRFLEFVKLCFAQKRKTLVNNLRTMAEPDRVRAALQEHSLRGDSRAEQLSVTQLAALYSAFGEEINTESTEDTERKREAK
jgi:16S rRNA (adenine1518-N6/adenine1519-N6)-dimethyltransferase